MIRFPYDLVMTKYDGYFWSHTTFQLYSIKGGLLKPLQYRKLPEYIKQKHNLPDGYRVSVGGKIRHLSLDYLRRLPKADGQVQVLPIVR